MVRHGQVEEENVGLDFGGKLYRLAAVAGFAHHFHVRLRFEQPSQAVAENRMIVGNDDADGTTLSIHCSSFVPVGYVPPLEHRVPGSILS